MNLGPVTKLTPDQARKRAEEAHSLILAGTSPKAIEDEESAKINFEEYSSNKNKKSTYKTYIGICNRHLITRFTHVKVEDIDYPDVYKMHDEIAKYSVYTKKPAPGAADDAVGLLQIILDFAEKWKKRPLNSNPCRLVKKNGQRKRKRYLKPNHPKDENGNPDASKPSELDRYVSTLWDAYRNETERKDYCIIFFLLLLTGARKNEILRLEWSEVNMREMQIEKQDHKTKTTTKNYDEDEDKIIKLNTLAAWFLSQVDKRHHKWVFPSYICKNQPYEDIDKVHHRIRKMAKIEDFIPHDLRRTYASVLKNKGHNLKIIGDMLGQTQQGTTEGYAFLYEETRNEICEIESVRIATPATDIKISFAGLIPLNNCVFLFIESLKITLAYLAIPLETFIVIICGFCKGEFVMAIVCPHNKSYQ